MTELERLAGKIRFLFVEAKEEPYLVSRLRELDELCTKLYAVTGYSVEQLLALFLAGYTLSFPKPAASMEEIGSSPWFQTNTNPPEIGKPVILFFDTGETAGGYCFSIDESGLTSWRVCVDAGIYQDCTCIPSYWMPRPSVPEEYKGMEGFCGLQGTN